MARASYLQMWLCNEISVYICMLWNWLCLGGKSQQLVHSTVQVYTTSKYASTGVSSIEAVVKNYGNTPPWYGLG